VAVQHWKLLIPWAWSAYEEESAVFYLTSNIFLVCKTTYLLCEFFLCSVVLIPVIADLLQREMWNLIRRQFTNIRVFARYQRRSVFASTISHDDAKFLAFPTVVQSRLKWCTNQQRFYRSSSSSSNRNSGGGGITSEQVRDVVRL
jgi:hypothetical protein